LQLVRTVNDMTKRFQIKDLNIDNCFGSLIDHTMKTDTEHAYEYDSFDRPFALFRFISETTRFQQKLLKTQLENVDPLMEPEMYGLLRSLSQDVLKLWISSTESVQNYDFIDI
jgi:hypothetical protein